MADLLPGGKADVVAGLHHMALVSKQQRHLAFEDEGMLLLQQVIVPGCAAHAGRRPLDQNADAVVLAHRRARQMLVAVDEAAPELPFVPGEIARGDRREGLRSEEHTSELPPLIPTPHAG